MIFGTVGTHTAPFDRLVRALDGYAGQTAEKVIIQIGHATYEPISAEWFRMTNSEHMAACMRDADLVVTQASDSMLEAIRARKPVVAVPRQRRFGEAIDDHQLELARKVAATFGIVVIEDVADLDSALWRRSQATASIGTTAQRLVAALRGSIQEFT